jgi:hypothetical protein
VICDSFILTTGHDQLQISDRAMFDGHRILIPRGEWSGDAVRQVSSYIDDTDHFRQTDMEADRGALEALIRRLRSVDPMSTLTSLLQELKLEKYPALHGKTFRVTIGSACDPHAIEMMVA